MGFYINDEARRRESSVQFKEDEALCRVWRIDTQDSSEIE